MNLSKPRILIVEDEILLAEHIKMSLSDSYEVVGIAASADQAENLLATEAPDLALLDIMLRGKRDGIALAEVINERFQIPFIFLTSHADRELVERAKLVKPHAYLLKPYNEYEIPISIELALSNFEQRKSEESFENRHEFSPEDNQVLGIKNSLFLKKDTAYQKVRYEEIIYLEADSNYTVIQTDREKYIYSTVLKKIEARLPKNMFMRVHRSYVINLQAIEGYSGNILFVGDKKIPVSKVYRESLFQLFESL